MWRLCDIPNLVLAFFIHKSFVFMLCKMGPFEADVPFESAIANTVFLT